MRVVCPTPPAAIPLSALVRVSGPRWPIESRLEEGKDDADLDWYGLRFWRAAITV
jgi:glucose-6-phosphate dehydrogenase assembly protein OpcA